MPALDHTKTNPGMHKTFLIERFPLREQQILERLKNWWYLTNSGQEVTLGANAKLSYYLMKPVTSFAEMFNLEREIICVFSPYKNFEPRTFDAFDIAKEKYQELRPEAICRILISDDPKVEQKINDLLKSDPEQPIVVPFTYDEMARCDEYFIKNRFSRHFYTRNLFNFLSPLKRDLYFFGRSELIHGLVSRHRSGEHTGLFGLRKSGKTSIIYATERYLSMTDDVFVSIDCESPAIHQLRWNELLHKMVNLYKDKYGSRSRTTPVERYSEKEAADAFSKDMLSIFQSRKRRSTLFIFDEIERISPSTGSSDHWRNGVDFIYFWQTLRAFYQRNVDVFTYMMVGTNPFCVESPTLNGHENPLFKSVPSTFVPSFTVEQVREMVRKLGRYIGLKFNEQMYGLLADDFGGHPFLIRQVCSEIHKYCTGDRPITVDKPLYETVKTDFSRQVVEYLDMMLLVLRDWYPDEYDVLTFLAHGDRKSFEEFASQHEAYTKHLIGYGLIQHSANGYAFNIEALKEFISAHHKYERRNLGDDEKIAEISARRNSIEKALRDLVRVTLKVSKGSKNGLELVKKYLMEPRKQKIEHMPFEAVIARDSSPLFLLELITLLDKEWGIFTNVLEIEKETCMFILKEVNNVGRPDAHAKYLEEDEFTQLRLHFSKLEKLLREWL